MQERTAFSAGSLRRTDGRWRYQYYRLIWRCTAVRARQVRLHTRQSWAKLASAHRSLEKISFRYFDFRLRRASAVLSKLLGNSFRQRLYWLFRGFLCYPLSKETSERQSDRWWRSTEWSHLMWSCHPRKCFRGTPTDLVPTVKQVSVRPRCVRNTD